MRNQRLLILFAILFTLSAYIYQVMPFCLSHPQTCFGGIGDPTAKPTAPTAYRPLSAELMNIAGFDGTSAGRLLAALKLHLILIPAIFIAFYQWVKRWTSLVIPCVLSLALLFSLAFQFYLFDPAVLIEMLLVLLMLLFHKRFVFCMIIVVLGALNRETAIFLPFIYWIVDIGYSTSS